MRGLCREVSIGTVTHTHRSPATESNYQLFVVGPSPTGNQPLWGAHKIAGATVPRKSRPSAGCGKKNGDRIAGASPALTRISHTLSAAARDKAASTSLHLLTVLNALFKYVSAR